MKKAVLALLGLVLVSGAAQASTLCLKRGEPYRSLFNQRTMGVLITDNEGTIQTNSVATEITKALNSTPLTNVTYGGADGQVVLRLLFNAGSPVAIIARYSVLPLIFNIDRSNRTGMVCYNY